MLDMPAEDTQKSVRAFAPATIANVGPGFDCLGFALGGIGDAVELTVVDNPHKRKRVTIEVRGDDGRLPTKPAKNCASAVALAMLDEAEADFGVNILLGKGMPIGSGLGSSAASSAAAAVAMNELFDNQFEPEELVRFAALGEEVACGTPHLDNVAPAVLGGFVLVRHSRTIQAITLDTPDWWVGVCRPQIELPTRQARAALPKQVSLHDLTCNVSNSAAMMVALMSGDLELFGRSLMADVVVERCRAELINHYDLVRQAALEAGAAGVTIAGAGPSVFAVAADRAEARTVGEAMAAVWLSLGIDSDVYVSRFGDQGARLAE